MEDEQDLQYQQLKKSMQSCDINAFRKHLTYDFLRAYPNKIIDYALEQPCNVKLIIATHKKWNKHHSCKHTTVAHAYNKKSTVITKPLTPYLAAISKHSNVLAAHLPKEKK